MYVTELIDTISQFAFGTLATERQRSEYLRCLNFANNDVYIRLRNFKHFIIYKEQKINFDNNQYYFNFDFKKYFLKSIYNKDVKLTSFDLLTNDNLIITPKHYFTLVSENKVLLGTNEYNKDSDGDNFVKVFYNLQQKTLVENINDPDTETDVTIYDSIVNQTLVLGAVYYIFLTTNGQMSKLSSAYKLFNDKLDDITKFYT